MLQAWVGASQWMAVEVPFDVCEWTVGEHSKLENFSLTLDFIWIHQILSFPLGIDELIPWVVPLSSTSGSFVKVSTQESQSQKMYQPKKSNIYIYIYIYIKTRQPIWRRILQSLLPIFLHQAALRFLEASREKVVWWQVGKGKCHGNLRGPNHPKMPPFPQGKKNTDIFAHFYGNLKGTPLTPWSLNNLLK